MRPVPGVLYSGCLHRLKFGWRYWGLLDYGGLDRDLLVSDLFAAPDPEAGSRRAALLLGSYAPSGWSSLADELAITLLWAFRLARWSEIPACEDLSEMALLAVEDPLALGPVLEVQDARLAARIRRFREYDEDLSLVAVGLFAAALRGVR